MAKIQFLPGAAAVSVALETLIREAKPGDVLYVLSAYWEASLQIQRLLIDAANRGVVLRLLCGKKNGQWARGEWMWIQKLSNAETRFSKPFHGKIFLNGEAVVEGSMNLHQYSQRNNEEHGTLVTEDGDRDYYLNALHFAESVWANAVPITPPPGYCIGCRKNLGLFQPERPLCKACWYRTALRNGQAAPYCHGCGDETTVSRARPLCRPCYDTYRNCW